MTMLHSLLVGLAVGGLAQPAEAQEGIGDELAEALEERAVPEDTGLGFMEFFDWLAGASDREIQTMHHDLVDPSVMIDISEPLTRRARYDLGLRIWGAL